MTEIFNKLLIDLLKTMARVYDFLIKIAEGTDVSKFAGPIEDMVSTLYILAGVFMLFRITVTFINMLIDPDKVSDKNAGAGKTLTNVIVTIVLLILFQPGGFIYSELSRLERAMLGTPGTENTGFISRLVNVKETAEGNNSIGNNIVFEENETTKIPFVENVYADEPLTCYFVKKVAHLTSADSHGIVKLTFYPNKVNGAVEIKGADSNYKGYVKSWVGTKETSEVIYGEEITFKNFYGTSYKVPVGTAGANDPFIDSFPNDCGSITLRMGGNANLSTNSSPVYLVNDNWGQNLKSWNAETSTGTSKLDTALADYLQYLNKNQSTTGNNTDSISNFEDVKGKTEENGGYATNAEKFANGIAATIYSCNDVGEFKDLFGPVNSEISKEDKDKCETMQKNIMNQKFSDITDQINSETMSADFIIGIILVIGFIIFLTILCVDVIIRNFKLVLLQMIAPIPIINGIDPKDKMRGEWMKMYFQTYFILFVYLFAIKLVSALMVIDITQFMENESILGSGLVQIFYIIALLVFAKMAPNLVMKIFGISSDASSFKQIGGMLKGAALATGGVALLGGVAGARGIKNTMAEWKKTTDANGNALSTTKRAINTAGVGMASLGTAAGAMIYGGTAGAKGKMFAASKAFIDRDEQIQQQKAEGLTFMDRMAMGIAGATGIAIAGNGKQAEEQIKASQNVQSKIKALKDYALGEVQKKGHVIDATTLKTDFFQEVRDKEGNLLFTGISAKDSQVQITRKSDLEVGIDMKTEYNNLEIISNMSVDDYKNSAFKIIGANGKAIEDYSEALRFQQRRVVALEDYAVADRINTDRGPEMTQTIQGYNDAVDESKLAGVEFARVEVGKVNSKTISSIKDSAIDKQMEIAKENEKNLARQKYMGKKQ